MSGSNNVAAVNLDYDEHAKAQETDKLMTYAMALKSQGGLRLCYLEFALVKLPIWCDVSIGKPRPFVPQDFCRAAHDLLHNLSHPCGWVTRKLVSARFVWPKMNSTITAWCHNCLECQKAKIGRHISSPLMQFRLPDSRFDQVHVDIVGPLSVS